MVSRVLGRGHTVPVTDLGHPGGDGSLPPEWTAPDDARALEGDLRAWRREQAAAARRQRFAAAAGRRWRWRGSSGLVIALVLLGVTALGVGLVVVAPIGLPTTSEARPLASPTRSPGSIGGLLPSVTVRVGAKERAARELRPAVLAMLPQPCRCTLAVRELSAVVGQFALPLVLVTVAGNAEIGALLTAARGSRSYPAYDAAATLADAYAARGLTAVLVRADGVVTAVQRDLRPGQPIGGALGELAR